MRFSSSTYAVGESSTVVYVLVWRLGPTNTQVDVTVQSTAAGTAEAGPCGTGGDYTPVGVLVTFLPGQTGQWVPITLCPDAEADGTETIGLALANPVGATLGTPNTAMVTITENDVAGKIQFAAAANSVSEAQGTATVLVTRTGGEASGVTVHWRVNGGTAVHGIAPASSVDYMGETSGTLMFGEKQMSQALTIPIQYRPNAQGPRSVELLLDLAGGGGALGVQTSATLWILDAD